jgi:cation/acetate symporter
MGVPNQWIGYGFVFLTLAAYAVIGIISRTMEAGEYYVAGRRVPTLYNGMATGADWMSAASFVGMAGSLFLLGYDGLAFVLGWTGGYVLVAILIAPYLRKFGAYRVHGASIRIVTQQTELLWRWVGTSWWAAAN